MFHNKSHLLASNYEIAFLCLLTRDIKVLAPSFFVYFQWPCAPLSSCTLLNFYPTKLDAHGLPHAQSTSPIEIIRLQDRLGQKMNLRIAHELIVKPERSHARFCAELFELNSLLYDSQKIFGVTVWSCNDTVTELEHRLNQLVEVRQDKLSLV